MNIIIQYYNDKDPERQKEYDYCLEQNLANPAIKKIYNIIEKETIVPLKFLHHKKMITFPIDYKKSSKNLPGRLTFNYVFEYARNHIPKNEVVATLNLDIFIQHSQEWLNIKRDFFDKNKRKKVLCLSRINCIAKSHLENGALILSSKIPSWWYKFSCDTWPGASSDAWIFMNPIDMEDCNFCVGNSIMMDGALHYRFKDNNYQIYNWCEKYKIFHYDICRGHNDIPNNGKIIPTCDPEGRLAYNRGGLEVPPIQNWEGILANEEEVLYCYMGTPLHNLINKNIDKPNKMDNVIKKIQRQNIELNRYIMEEKEKKKKQEHMKKYRMW